MKTRWLVAFYCIALGLNACGNPQPEPGPDLNVEQLPEQLEEADLPELDIPPDPPVYMHEIIDPQPGSVIPKSSFMLRFSGHSFGGIESFEVQVDGNVIGIVTPDGYGSGGPVYGHVFYGQMLWIPNGYGDFLIAIRAKGTGISNYSEFMEVTVTVGASAYIEEASDIPEVALLPSCGPEDLTPPSLIIPWHYAYLGTTPTETFIPPDLFQWSNTSGCIPEKFRILMSPDPNYGWARMGYTAGYQTSWPLADAEWPQLALDPATMYYWTVNAWTDGVHGPDSVMRIFFTGPACNSAAELVAPELITPHDNDQFSNPSVKLHYEPGEPKCLPNGYFVDLQTDLNFNGTSLVGLISSPTTYVTTDELDDCTTYYWRVAATFSLDTGPFSETRSFYINQTGTCIEPMSGPFIEALIDQRCLQGPDPQKYPVSGYFLTGETAPIVAQDLREEWWVIPNPDGDDFCFVRKADNQATGDTSDVSRWNDPEVEQAPPALTCKRELDESDCLAAGGTWMKGQVGSASYCQCD